MHDASVLLVGQSSSINPDVLRNKLQLPSSCSIVADTWMEASIAAGAPAPLQQHVMIAAAAAAVGVQEPQLGHKRGVLHIADSAAGNSAGDPAAKRQHTASAAETATAGSLAAGASLPAAAAAAGSAQTADALKAVIASRLWVPAQQQLQQHRHQQDGQQQQQQQQQMLQHSADSGELQSQNQQQQQQQQQQPGRLDVSWMSSTAIRVLSYNILADMYATG
jgi:hypothetical protein